MKIAFFHELTPLSGARKTVEEYGRILGKDHTIDLFYIDDVEDKKIKSIFSKIYFFKFESKKYEGNDWKTRLYKDSIELIKLYFLHKKISNIINKNKYDFVFVHPSKFTQAPFILRFLKTPKIYYCQEPLRIVYDPFVSNFSQLSFLKKSYEGANRLARGWIDKTNLDSSDLILANSSFSKKWIKLVYGRDSYVCYLGVDADKFRPLKIRKSYDVLFLGQRDKIEGYDLLMAAILKFRQKPRVGIIERGVDGQGIEDEELVREINRARIVVALSRNEPFGLVPLEVMACGVPIVAVSEGGFKESIKDGETGFLVERKAEDLYLILKKLLVEGKLREKLGKNGREYVLGNWSWEKSTQRFLEITAKCLKK